MRLQRLAKFILPIILLLLLAGCDSSIWNRYPPPKLNTHNGAAAGVVTGAIIGGVAAGSVAGAGFGAIAGGIIGASIGDILHSHMDLVKKLQYNGVQVIELGDEIKLILPTDRFFKPNSALMNMQYYYVLGLVAKFIKQFPKITVKVACYTSNLGAWQRNLAISRSRAKSIMRYLWDYGVNARLIYAVGYGSKNPIANNNTIKGQALNNRVEITLRKIRNYNDF